MSLPRTPSTAADRLLTPDAGAHRLGDLRLDPASVRGGVPSTALTELGMLGDRAVGLWELTPGTVTDVEVDEVFVVVGGRGTVAFADGSVLDLRPGVVVRLAAGDETTWTVTETLRKVWVA